MKTWQPVVDEKNNEGKRLLHKLRNLTLNLPITPSPNSKRICDLENLLT
ncbi:MAG TPA: hypothetical protein VIH28_08835 [Ignavibacteriaceae bacterium]